MSAVMILFATQSLAQSLAQSPDPIWGACGSDASSLCNISQAPMDATSAQDLFRCFKMNSASLSLGCQAALTSQQQPGGGLGPGGSSNQQRGGRRGGRRERPSPWKLVGGVVMVALVFWGVFRCGVRRGMKRAAGSSSSPHALVGGGSWRSPGCCCAHRGHYANPMLAQGVVVAPVCGDVPMTPFGGAPVEAV